MSEVQILGMWIDEAIAIGDTERANRMFDLLMILEAALSRRVSS